MLARRDKRRQRGRPDARPLPPGVRRNTLALITSDLEAAAAILRTGRLAVVRTVTLPMVAPVLVVLPLPAEDRDKCERAGQERTGISLEGSSRDVARAATCSTQYGSRSTKIRNQSSRLMSGQTTSGDMTPSRSRSG